MYQSETTHAGVSRARIWTAGWPVVPPTVWYLGLTSLLTDISSEMVASVLPMYFVLHLNLSPLAFGMFDGLYNSAGAFARWGSGVLADRRRHYKALAVLGYGISAVCRLGLLAAGSSKLGLGAVVASDRLGKGIRTVPRDAMISLSAPQNRLAQSFGVHRALDATGAMLGPAVGVAVLALVPGGFDVVFVTSFCIAMIGLGILVLFVDSFSQPASADETGTSSLRVALELLRRADFRVLTMAAAGLALVTVSDPFVYLVLQERMNVAPATFPLLYMGTSLSYLLLAVPAGMLADRIGKPRVFVLGHGLLICLYAWLLTATAHGAVVFVALLLLGAYYAATDGVVVAAASAMVPAAQRGNGLALITTAISAARLVASVAFGWLWTTLGRDAAIAVFGSALSLGLAIAAVSFNRSEWSTHE